MVTKDRLASIVGVQNIIGSGDVLQSHSRECSLEAAGSFSYVVRPANVTETQKLIQLANEARFAVVPQSSGIHFNGCAVPKEGGVVLDLSGMDRIVDLVSETRVAHLQVGVTWAQFANALATKGYRPIIPLLPHASRSVIMDYLERQQPVVQNHEFADPLLSMQVVWGNGELFVTGSASAGNFRNGSLADGVLPSGPGPMSWDPFLYGAQGTMGVVTWGVVQFETIPALSKAFFIPIQSIAQAIDPLYNILRRGICEECLLLNNIDLAMILSGGQMPELAGLRASLPPWTVIMVSSALKRRPQEKIAYQEACLRDIMTSSFPGLDLWTGLPGIRGVETSLPEMLRKPWPKARAYWKHAFKGGCQDFSCVTTLDQLTKFIPVVEEVAARHQYLTSDVGCYVQPLQDGRACQIQFSFFYNSADEAERRNVRSLWRDAVKAVLDEGGYVTLPYPAIADIVFKEYGEYAALLKRFKKHFDPNGILNPGNLCF